MVEESSGWSEMQQLTGGPIANLTPRVVWQRYKATKSLLLHRGNIMHDNLLCHSLRSRDHLVHLGKKDGRMW
jgi:hypothetical protein